MREDDRLVVGCRYFLGLSEEETAAALGVAARHGQVADVAGAGTATRRMGVRAMSELERALQRLGGELAFPEAPDVVRAGGAAGSARPAARRSTGLRALVLALAALVVAVGGGHGRAGGAQRHPRVLRVQRGTVQRVETLPEMFHVPERGRSSISASPCRWDDGRPRG